MDPKNTTKNTKRKVRLEDEVEDKDLWLQLQQQPYTMFTLNIKH